MTQMKTYLKGSCQFSKPCLMFGGVLNLFGGCGDINARVLNKVLQWQTPTLLKQGATLE